ncbi:hypothetical protein FACS1894191_0160 [Clostridia bacterium]|nr:hypothetical protein FACS1894191_0160 [Clostridia bacterium]
MKNKLPPMLALVLFAAIGLTLWRTTGKLFYMMNFGYIGAFLRAYSGSRDGWHFRQNLMPCKEKPERILHVFARILTRQGANFGEMTTLGRF